MTHLNGDPDYKKIRTKISGWLENRISEDAFQWIRSTSEKLKTNAEDWELFTAFSSVPRHTGKEIVKFTEEDLESAAKMRENWKPVNWTADQFARTYLLLSYADRGEDEFLDKIEKIFITSDLGESVALYQGLPVYPYPEKFKDRAAEGIRSNITTVFNAVALNNPYPAEYLDEGAWNQVVLKALFVESPVYKIIGIDNRANETLAKILVEYAHERWSAGRSVSPELWRPVGPFLDDNYAKDIKKVLNHPDKIQKKAAILALQTSNYPGTNDLLEDYQDLVNEMADDSVSWDDVGKEFEKTT
ncbi:MAG: EboA domain-containing protein [Balneolaceae bacterium]